jgi:hypothetical protein
MRHFLKPDKSPVVRNRYFLVADVVLVFLSTILSFVLRLDPPGVQVYGRTMLLYATLAVLVKPAVFYSFGL